MFSRSIYAAYLYSYVMQTICMKDDDEPVSGESASNNNNNTEPDNAIDVDSQDASYNITFDELKDPVPIQQTTGKKGFFDIIEHGLFSLMRGKKRPVQEPLKEDTRFVPAKEEEPVKVSGLEDLFEESKPQPSAEVSSTHHIKSRGGPLGVFAKIFFKTIYLVLFGAGVYMISSELPTHPSLVIGLVLVAVGANVLSKES